MKLWLTMTKFCFASSVLLVTGVAGTAAGAGTAATDHGAVYTMTNSTTGNAVVVYDRAADGTLAMSGNFPTGGTSIGFFATGNQNGLLLSKDGRCLWAVNSGSNQISAFQVMGTNLKLTNMVGSGGQRPISVAVNANLSVLYVLNAGGQVGSSDNVTGFTVGTDCGLSSLAGSTRPLSASDVSPAQVGFDPTGSVLVVTEKTNNGGMRGGKIDTFVVGSGGLLSSSPNSLVPPVTEPFGFAFDNRGRLLVTAADCSAPALPGNLPGCMVPPDQPSLLSYTLMRNGALALVDESPDDQAAKCWIVITDNQQRGHRGYEEQDREDGEFAFTVNALATQTRGTPGSPPAGSITSYRVSLDGSLTKLGATPIPVAPAGVPVDAALSLDSRFLYVLSEADGIISAYKVEPDGLLSLLNTYAVTDTAPISAMPPGSIPFPNGLAAR